MVNLFEAIIQKNTQKVKSILEQGTNPNSIIDASPLGTKVLIQEDLNQDPPLRKIYLLKVSH